MLNIFGQEVKPVSYSYSPGQGLHLFRFREDVDKRLHEFAETLIPLSRYSFFDWPHHAYAVEGDVSKLLEDFADQINLDPDTTINLDGFHDRQEKVDINSISYQLAMILQGEVTKEINKEIIEKLNDAGS